MKTIEVNGKQIRTNYGGNPNNGFYPSLRDSMNVTRIPFGVSEWEFLTKKVEEGYTTITFYDEATCIRGYHHTYARCKR